MLIITNSEKFTNNILHKICSFLALYIYINSFTSYFPSKINKKTSHLNTHTHTQRNSCVFPYKNTDKSKHLPLSLGKILLLIDKQKFRCSTQDTSSTKLPQNSIIHIKTKRGYIHGELHQLHEVFVIKPEIRLCQRDCTNFKSPAPNSPIASFLLSLLHCLNSIQELVS